MGISGEGVGTSGGTGTTTHMGPHLALGYDSDGYCIWDRERPGPPLIRFPRNDEGWARAWEEFTHLEEGETIQTVEAEAATAGQEPPGTPAGSIRREPRAIASLVLGLLGIVPVGILSIASFALAIRARRRIERGESRGNAMAITGMVVAIVGMGWSALFATALIGLSYCGFLETPPDAPSWCDSGGAFFAIWAAIWVGEALVAAAIAPMSQKRWRETGVAMGVVVVLMAVGVLIPIIVDRSRSNRPRFPQTPEVEAPAVRPPPTLGSTVMSDDFSDPSSGWHEESTDTFAFGYVRGEYRVAVKVPDEFRYWVQWTDQAYDTVRVAADVRRAKGTAGTFGILCESNGDAAVGYVFLIDPEIGRYEVWQLFGDSRSMLDGGTSAAIRSGSRTNSLEGYCDSSVPGAPTVLTFFVNGTQVIQIQAFTLSSFSGVGMYAASASGGIDARFDNLVMSV